MEPFIWLEFPILLLVVELSMPMLPRRLRPIVALPLLDLREARWTASCDRGGESKKATVGAAAESKVEHRRRLSLRLLLSILERRREDLILLLLLVLLLLLIIIAGRDEDTTVLGAAAGSEKIPILCVCVCL